MKVVVLLCTLAVTMWSIQGEESQVLQDFEVGYRKFAGNVYKEVAKVESGNFMVCPLSANIILALVHDGAESETAEQLQTGLNLPKDKQKVRQIFRELLPNLKGNADYTLTSANKIYLKNKYAIRPEFKSTATDVFHADIQTIDFSDKKSAAAAMNAWVEEQTHNKIKDMVSEDAINEDTRSFLINAMYFHGQWLKQFNIEHTKKLPFYVKKDSHVDIEMMDIVSGFNYHTCDMLNATFLEIPYEGGDVSMTFILPDDVEGLPALEQNMDMVLQRPALYKSERVHAIIPKFKMETTIDFNRILKSFGIVDAFEDSAQFQGISETPVKISDVVQKTFIEVEEKGTTAASSTSVSMSLIRSGHLIRPEPKLFRADHPFIYCIRSAKAGVLFVGRFVQEAK